MHRMIELINSSKPEKTFSETYPIVTDASPLFKNTPVSIHQDTDYRYYTDTWNKMKQLVYTIDWRIKSDGPSESEKLSDQFSAQLSAQLRAQADAQVQAVIVAGGSLVVGKGIAKLSKKLPAIKNTKHKFLKGNIRTETTTFFGQRINFSASHKFQVKGVWGQEITRKGLGRNVPIIAGEISTKDVIQTAYNSLQPSEEYQAFDTLGEHPVISTIVDIMPLAGNIKSIIDGLANAALAYQNYQIANRIDKTTRTAKERFNQRLQHSLHKDIEAMKIEDIKKLMKYLNIKPI
jgi:hypothetical protein